jgi:hypothetical protein
MQSASRIFCYDELCFPTGRLWRFSPLVTIHILVTKLFTDIDVVCILY